MLGVTKDILSPPVQKLGSHVPPRPPPWTQSMIAGVQFKKTFMQAVP